MTTQKFGNVRNIRIGGKKYSVCDIYYYSERRNAWVYDSKLFCEGWYKKGETVYKKWLADKQG